MQQPAAQPTILMQSLNVLDHSSFEVPEFVSLAIVRRCATVSLERFSAEKVCQTCGKWRVWSSTKLQDRWTQAVAEARGTPLLGGTSAGRFWFAVHTACSLKTSSLPHLRGKIR